MYSKVDVQIMKQFDRMAKIKQIYASVGDGTSFWDLVDGSADQTYENMITGSTITAMDTLFDEANIGSIASIWFTLHDSYYTTDLSLSNLTGYLSSKHIRVNEDCAQVYYEVYSSRLAARYVAADQDKTANILMTFDNTDTPKYSTLPASLDTTFGNTPIGCKVTTSPTGTDIIFDITVKNTNGETFVFHDVTIPVGTDDTGYLYGYNPNTGAYGTGYEVATDYFDIFFETAVTSEFYPVIGEARLDPSVNSTLAAGATTIGLLDNDSSKLVGFSPNGFLVILDTETSANFETTDTDYDEGIYRMDYVQIGSLDGNVVTIASALLHDYNYSTCVVYPCFNGITAFSLDALSNTTDGVFKITPVDDRTPAL